MVTCSGRYLAAPIAQGIIPKQFCHYLSVLISKTLFCSGLSDRIFTTLTSRGLPIMKGTAVKTFPPGHFISHPALLNRCTIERWHT